MTFEKFENLEAYIHKVMQTVKKLKTSDFIVFIQIIIIIT